MGGGSSIPLEPGRFLSSSVKNGAYLYYKSAVDRGEGFAVTVYADRGDPNLFVSNQTPKPVEKTAMWKSTHYGRDMIYVPPEDPHYKSGNFYVGVQGAGNARFSVVAGPIVRLKHGITITTSVQKGKYQFFIIDHDNPAAVLNVWVTPQGGGARAPVSLFASRSLIHPYRGSNTWNSHRGDPLDINPKHPSFKPGTFYIGMIGETQQPTTVHLTAASLVTLQDGIPVEGFVKDGSYSYYSFFSGNPNADVTTFLDPLPGPDGKIGDPDLYLCSKNIHPTLKNHTWKSDREGSDFVTVAHTHPMFKVGNFYIGVYGSTDVSFVITAESKIALRDSVPYSDWCRAKETRHFESIVDSSEPVQGLLICLTPATPCDVELFVSRNSRPTKENSIWSYNVKGGGCISIPSTDPNFDSGTFFMTARMSADTSFTMTSTVIPVHGMIPLQKSVPTREKVRKGEIKYYKLNMTPDDAKFNDLYLSMKGWNSSQVACNMYVARDIRPTASDAVWSADFFDTAMLSILHQDPKFSEGDYYISVEAKEDSQYVITYSVSHEEVAAVAFAQKFARKQRNKIRGRRSADPPRGAEYDEPDYRSRSANLSPGGEDGDGSRWDRVKHHHRRHRRKHRHRMATVVDESMKGHERSRDKDRDRDEGFAQSTSHMDKSSSWMSRDSSSETENTPHGSNQYTRQSQSNNVSQNQNQRNNNIVIEDADGDGHHRSAMSHSTSGFGGTEPIQDVDSVDDLERQLFGELSPRSSLTATTGSDSRSLAQQASATTHGKSSAAVDVISAFKGNATATASELYTGNVPKLDFGKLKGGEMSDQHPDGPVSVPREIPSYAGTSGSAAAIAAAAQRTAMTSRNANANSLTQSQPLPMSTKSSSRRFGLEDVATGARSRVAAEAGASRRVAGAASPHRSRRQKNSSTALEEKIMAESEEFW